MRFLAILAALFSPSASGIYFFEEIDNGIHPNRVWLLMDLLQNEAVRKDAQIITTTHSPQMLTFMNDDTFESASVVYRDEDYEDAIIRPLADIGDAKKLRKADGGLGELHATGWMETILGFDEFDRRQRASQFVKTLIIPEDFRNDQYLLKPIFTRLFRNMGVRPKVTVCNDPLLGGIGEALKVERMREIVLKYRGKADLFILCVDRDGDGNRRQSLDRIEASVKSELVGGRIFLAECAWEEVETWALAGLDLPNHWRWSDVRAEVHVKETYFEPLVESRGLSGSRGGGRVALGQEAARRITAIRQKCPDDFDALANLIESAMLAA